jgi:polar amino acid transport system substrate-binding protein
VNTCIFSITVPADTSARNQIIRPNRSAAWTHSRLKWMLALAALLPLTAALPAMAQRAQNDELRAQLPKEVLDRGSMTSVFIGSYPPYSIAKGAELTGATKDLGDAVGALLGIKIEHVTVNGVSGMLAGILSGRYQFSMGPVADSLEREKANDLVDWAKENVVFGVRQGNSAGITNLASTCGKRIAVMAGASAEKVINQQSAKCVAEGHPAIQVQSYLDQPTSILAVRASRSDAFFSAQAQLTYFMKQAGGGFELAGVGQDNGFGVLHQGAVVPKDSPLGPVLLKAFKVLVKNGTYKEIMKRWGLEGNTTDDPGINLAGKVAQK